MANKTGSCLFAISTWLNDEPKANSNCYQVHAFAVQLSIADTWLFNRDTAKVNQYFVKIIFFALVMNNWKL